VLGVSAASVAACGGGSKSTGNTSTVSSLITRPVDTTKTAKRGGVFKWFWKGDPPNFDPSFASTLNRTPKNLANSLLVQIKPGYMAPQTSEVIPDLAESWEVSGDKTEIVFKLRPGVKWHNLPPLNGRELDVQDVLFSWERLLRLNANSATLANAVNPNAPILGITSPDPRTVVFKLKQPNSYILTLIGDQVGGNMVIVPREADTTLDLRRTLLGTGPYILTNYTPSVGLTFKRNPDYYDKERPYIDQIEMPIVPEYATQLAQFRSGAIYQMAVTSQDILAQKRDIPELSLYAGDVAANGTHTAFGWLPSGKSPFLDQRVRQAYSLSWDRDLFIETAGNTRAFESEGLPIQKRWNSSIPCNFEGYWLDPKGKEFGPSAKYYKHDPAEAKKLLAAAGYANGLDIVETATPSIGNADQVQIVNGFASEVGFRIALNSVDLTTKYTPMRDSLGQFDGLLVKAGTSGAGPIDAIGRFAYEYSAKGGPNFYGFNATGQSDPAGDPQVEALIDRGLAEFDIPKRRQIAFDLQRYLAEKLYLVYYPGGSSGFDIAWPALRNFDVFTGSLGGGTDQLATYYWIDQTEPPLKKA